MPLYDYECDQCGAESERMALMAERNSQKCECGGALIIVHRPTPRYKPFNNYFDIGLGVEITGRDHRRRVMRDLGMDFRDHPSPGDTTARKDRCNEARKREVEMGVRDRRTGVPLS